VIRNHDGQLILAASVPLLDISVPLAEMIDLGLLLRLQSSDLERSSFGWKGMPWVSFLLAEEA